MPEVVQPVVDAGHGPGAPPRDRKPFQETGCLRYASSPLAVWFRECDGPTGPPVDAALGNGSQDYIVLGHSSDWLLYEGRLNFQVDKEPLAYQMAVALIAWRYSALVPRYASSVVLVGPFNAPTVPGS